MQQKVESMQVRQLEALDLAMADPREMLSDALDRERLGKDRLPLGTARDHADVAGVTLVAGARVGEFQ